MTFQLIFLLILILLSGFFSATETAYTSLSLYQIQDMVRRRGPKGKLVEYLSDRPELLLTTILIGNNLVNIAASAIATSLTISLFGNRAIGAMTGVMTLVILIFGEVTPKRIAIINNEFISLHTARLVYFLSLAFRPFIWFISGISSLVTRLFGSKKKHKITLQGVLHMVNLAENLGILENYKTRMVKSVFRFSDVTVSAIMTHRTRVFSLEMSRKLGDVVEDVLDHGYSRVPVYDEDPENVEGIVLVKEMMKHIAREERDLPLKSVMIKPIFVPHTKKIGEMFIQFKREKLNIAVVMDEYGGLAGIVTLEDVIEEILGEIYDEHEKRGREKITCLGDESYLIIGDTPIYVVQDALDIHLSHGKNVQTVSGYLTELAGRIPQKQEVIATSAGKFTIENVNRNRILTVRFTKHPETEQE